MRHVAPALIVLGLTLASLSVPAVACLWDSDTLAAEARGVMDVVRVITGRFERNPPAYHELRLARSADRIKADPDALDAYDDAGVASDRLGRSDEAIAWMDRKAARIDALRETGDPTTLRDQTYRRLANRGTFVVHRWLRAGADRARIAEVERARDLIAEAIRVNPDAHFGREVYQLKALEWIIRGKETLPYGLGGFVDLSDGKKPDPDAVRGIAGLIALGDAWESVDVFNTLAQVIESDGQRASVAYLAGLRAAELIDAGRRSLAPAAPTDPADLKGRIGHSWMSVGNTAGPQDSGRLDAFYRSLRAEADAWHASRLAFMAPASPPAATPTPTRPSGRATPLPNRPRFRPTSRTFGPATESPHEACETSPPGPPRSVSPSWRRGWLSGASADDGQGRRSPRR